MTRGGAQNENRVQKLILQHRNCTQHYHLHRVEISSTHTYLSMHLDKGEQDLPDVAADSIRLSTLLPVEETRTHPRFNDPYQGLALSLNVLMKHPLIQLQQLLCDPL